MNNRYWDNIKIIDEKLSIFSESSVNYICNIINNDLYKKYIWTQKLPFVDNLLDWFILLYKYKYFDPAGHPKTIIEEEGEKRIVKFEYWIVLQYLEKVSEKLKEVKKVEVNIILNNIINDIINYKEEINSPTTIYSIIKILSNINSKDIDHKQIEYIFDIFNNNAYNYSFPQSEISTNLLPKILEDDNKKLSFYIFKRILEYKLLDDKHLNRFIPIYDEYWLGEAISNNIKLLIKVCGSDILESLIHIVTDMMSKVNNTFDYISDIHHGSMGGYDDKIINYICDFIDGYDGGSIKSIIELLMSRKEKIFKRISLYAIDKHYEALKEIFWKSTTKINPLLIPEESKELHSLLSNNSKYFTKEQIDIVVEWIEQISFEKEEIEEEKKEIITAYRKRQWLKSILSTENENVKRLYDEYGAINNIEPSPPFWGVSMGPFSYVSHRPKDLISFEEKTNEDICSYLREVHIDKYDQLEIRTIHEKFSESVIKYPNKYLDNLSPYKDVHIQWHVDLISGFNGAWKNKEEIKWDLLLEFISEIISKEKYLQQIEGENNYPSNAIYRIADLIDSGASDKEHTFDIKYIDKAENILFKIVKYAKSNIDDKYAGSLSNAVLNSEIGRVLTALVNLSLLYARNLPDQKIKSKWKESIKKYFDTLLDRANNVCIEYSVVLGQYLPNFYYLDREWLKDNINRIFPKDNEIHWKATIEGYLTHFNVVFNEIFHLLKENEIYEDALGKKYENDNVRKSLVQHICIGYYAGWIKEKSNSNLMNILLKNSDDEDINQIVHAVIRSKDNIKKKHLINKLWGMIYKTMYWGKGKYIKAHEGLVRWLEVVDKIDKRIIKWLSFSIEKSVNGFFLKNLIRGLEKHYMSNTKEVGELLVLTTRHNKYLQYQDEKFLAILNKVYEMGYKDIGDEICNKYGENERYWVRPVYEKYQNKEVP